MDAKRTNCAYNWMAPELMEEMELPNEMSDMFGFCSLFWELFNVAIPWADMEWKHIKEEITVNNKSLPVNFELIPLPFSRIIKDGLSRNCVHRMSFEEVKMNLENVRNLISVAKKTASMRKMAKRLSASNLNDKLSEHEPTNINQQMPIQEERALEEEEEEQDEEGKEEPINDNNKQTYHDAEPNNKKVSNNSMNTMNSVDDFSQLTANSFICCDAYRAEIHLRKGSISPIGESSQEDQLASESIQLQSQQSQRKQQQQQQSQTSRASPNLEHKISNKKKFSVNEHIDSASNNLSNRLERPRSMFINSDSEEKSNYFSRHESYKSPDGNNFNEDPVDRSSNRKNRFKLLETLYYSNSNLLLNPENKKRIFEAIQRQQKIRREQQDQQSNAFPTPNDTPEDNMNGFRNHKGQASNLNRTPSNHENPFRNPDRFYEPIANVSSLITSYDFLGENVRPSPPPDEKQRKPTEFDSRRSLSSPNNRDDHEQMSNRLSRRAIHNMVAESNKNHECNDPTHHHHHHHHYHNQNEFVENRVNQFNGDQHEESSNRTRSVVEPVRSGLLSSIRALSRDSISKLDSQTFYSMAKRIIENEEGNDLPPPPSELELNTKLAAPTIKNYKVIKQLFDNSQPEQQQQQQQQQPKPNELARSTRSFSHLERKSPATHEPVHQEQSSEQQSIPPLPRRKLSSTQSSLSSLKSPNRVKSNSVDSASRHRQTDIMQPSSSNGSVKNLVQSYEEIPFKEEKESDYKVQAMREKRNKEMQNVVEQSRMILHNLSHARDFNANSSSNGTKPKTNNYSDNQEDIVQTSTYVINQQPNEKQDNQYQLQKELSTISERTEHSSSVNCLATINGSTVNTSFTAPSPLNTNAQSHSRATSITKSIRHLDPNRYNFLDSTSTTIAGSGNFSGGTTGGSSEYLLFRNSSSGNLQTSSNNINNTYSGNSPLHVRNRQLKSSNVASSLSTPNVHNMNHQRFSPKNQNGMLINHFDEQTGNNVEIASSPNGTHRYIKHAKKIYKYNEMPMNVSKAQQHQHQVTAEQANIVRSQLREEDEEEEEDEEDDDEEDEVEEEEAANVLSESDENEMEQNNLNVLKKHQPIISDNFNPNHCEYCMKKFQSAAAAAATQEDMLSSLQGMTDSPSIDFSEALYLNEFDKLTPNEQLANERNMENLTQRQRKIIENNELLRKNFYKNWDSNIMAQKKEEEEGIYANEYQELDEKISSSSGDMRARRSASNRVAASAGEATSAASNTLAGRLAAYRMPKSASTSSSVTGAVAATTGQVLSTTNTNQTGAQAHSFSAASQSCRVRSANKDGDGDGNDDEPLKRRSSVKSTANGTVTKTSTNKLGNVRLDKHIIDTTKYKGYSYKLETRSNLTNQYHIKSLLTNEQTGHSLVLAQTKVQAPKILTKVIIDQ